MSGVLAASVCSFNTALAEDEYVTNAQKYLDSGQYPAALVEIKNALQTNPNDPQARVLLGKIYLQMGNPKAAEIAFLSARELGVTGEELDLMLDYAHLGLGAFNQVISETSSEVDRYKAMKGRKSVAEGKRV